MLALESNLFSNSMVKTADRNHDAWHKCTFIALYSACGFEQDWRYSSNPPVILRIFSYRLLAFDFLAEKHKRVANWSSTSSHAADFHIERSGDFS